MRGITRALAAIIGVEVVRLVARATDYLSGSALTQGAHYGDGLFMPALWGGACLTAAAVVVRGFLRNRPRMVVSGAFLAAAVSLMFAVAIAQLTIFHVPPDDWRIFFDHLCTAAIWVIIGVSVAFRSGVWDWRMRLERTRRSEGSTDGF